MRRKNELQDENPRSVRRTYRRNPVTNQREEPGGSLGRSTSDVSALIRFAVAAAVSVAAVIVVEFVRLRVPIALGWAGHTVACKSLFQPNVHWVCTAHWMTRMARHVSEKL